MVGKREGECRRETWVGVMVEEEKAKEDLSTEPKHEGLRRFEVSEEIDSFGEARKNRNQTTSGAYLDGAP